MILLVLVAVLALGALLDSLAMTGVAVPTVGVALERVGARLRAVAAPTGWLLGSMRLMAGATGRVGLAAAADGSHLPRMATLALRPPLRRLLMRMVAGTTPMLGRRGVQAPGLGSVTLGADLDLVGLVFLMAP